MPVILQGPQRFEPTVGETVASLGGEGPVAAITAGWRERENEIDELDALLEGRARNLRLYERWLDIAARDPEYAAAEHDRRHRIEELQTTYGIRLQHLTAAIAELQRRGGEADINGAAIDEAIEDVRRLDEAHLDRNRELDAEFYDRWQPHERPARPVSW